MRVISMSIFDCFNNFDIAFVKLCKMMKQHSSLHNWRLISFTKSSILVLSKCNAVMNKLQTHL